MGVKMIDMHSHILPSIDDGSKSIEETYNLIEEAKKAGFNGIVLTSHYMEGYYEEEESSRKELMDKLKVEDIKLYLGNEIYLSENIVNLVNSKKASSINGSRYILFEMPLNTKPMNVYEVVYELLQYKFVPILAHPERYTFVFKEPELIYELLEKGVLMQANYGSIIGQYGRKSQIMVKKFLESNMIHFFGSDAHRQNSIYPKMKQILKDLKGLIGEEKLNELSLINPNKVLNNEEIVIPEPEEIKFTLIEKMIMK